MLTAVGQFLYPIGDEQVKFFDVDRAIVVIVRFASKSFKDGFRKGSDPHSGFSRLHSWPVEEAPSFFNSSKER
ncbi:MAG: hypothetical protein GY801_04790 [bacterium]|nr:hypothetical protein [bacterium]